MRNRWTWIWSICVCVPPWEMTLLYGSMHFISMRCSCSPITTLLHSLLSLLSSAALCPAIASLDAAPAPRLDSSASPVCDIKTFDMKIKFYKFTTNYKIIFLVYFFWTIYSIQGECVCPVCTFRHVGIVSSGVCLTVLVEFQQVCLIRCVQLIYVDIQVITSILILCVQDIFWEERPLTVVQWHIHWWSSQLSPLIGPAWQIRRGGWIWSKRDGFIFFLVF